MLSMGGSMLIILMVEGGIVIFFLVLCSVVVIIDVFVLLIVFLGNVICLVCLCRWIECWVSNNFGCGWWMMGINMVVWWWFRVFWLICGCKSWKWDKKLLSVRLWYFMFYFFSWCNILLILLKVFWYFVFFWLLVIILLFVE